MLVSMSDVLLHLKIYSLWLHVDAAFLWLYETEVWHTQKKIVATMEIGQ